MSNLKDKLSANVRRAKATQAHVSEGQPAASVSNAAKPGRGAKTATKPGVAGQAQRSANFVEDSGSALFPQRVWPD